MKAQQAKAASRYFEARDMYREERKNGLSHKEAKDSVKDAKLPASKITLCDSPFPAERKKALAKI